MSVLSPSTPLRVGIIGAGVAGLGTAIFFSRQENVEIELFEQAKELREVGAGISLHHNVYKMLDILGARNGIPTHSGVTSQAPLPQQRNGRTLEVLSEKDWSSVPVTGRPVRTERYDESDAGIEVHFEDGTSTTVDLLVGADGILSVARHLTFPDNIMKYTGVIDYRTLVPWHSAKDIPDLPDAFLFSHGPNGHIFTTQVGNGKYEISTRVNLPEEKSQVSWGQPVAKSEVLKHYQGRPELGFLEIVPSDINQIALSSSIKDFHPALKALLDASSEDGWKQFAMFAAPRLESVVNKSGNVALLGDASHPLAGAFGAGAGFALEDAYVLTAVVEYARANPRALSFALRVYDQTRSPYYQLLYEILAGHAKSAKGVYLHEAGISSDEAVDRKIKAVWGGGDSPFIHAYDVKRAFEVSLKAELEREQGVEPTTELAEDLTAAHL